jgi:hypothetical protein
MSMQSNSQRRTLIAVAVIIAGGVVAGLVCGRDDRAPPAAPTAAEQAPASAAVRRIPAAPSTASSIREAPLPLPALSEQDIERLANDSMVGPAASRLAAIERLSGAPRDQALPLLERVLLNGDPGVDRPAALHGLRELALTQGDADERIRDTVRKAIYHGDDESLAAEAQETLDIIAESEAK